MSLSIANNIGALNARHNLTRSSTSLNKSIERLSSGFKVNRGADGPAALIISEKQRAQIAGLRQAIDNTEKAVSVVQTAEGALNEISNILVKVRSLALDSANAGVNGDDAFNANQSEIANSLDTINRIANNTQFGDKNLLDGSAGITGSSDNGNLTYLKASSQTSAGTYEVEVTTVAERANVTAGAAQSGNLAADETLTINGVSVTLNSGLSQAGVISRINEFSAQTGVIAEDDPNNAGRTRLYSTQFGASESISVVSDTAAGGAGTTTGFGNSAVTDDGENIQGTIDGVVATGIGNNLTSTSGASKGLVVQIAADATDAVDTVTGTIGNITIENQSLIFQIGANQNQTAAIAVNSVLANGLGVGVEGNSFTSLEEIDVTSAANAQDALGVIDAAIDEISNIRGELGAFQTNTLESIANNMRTTLENTVNAESVIRDTDFAEEISKFTNSQILVQAGTSVLGNANQTSQSILSLLQ